MTHDELAEAVDQDFADLPEVGVTAPGLRLVMARERKFFTAGIATIKAATGDAVLFGRAPLDEGATAVTVELGAVFSRTPKVAVTMLTNTNTLLNGVISTVSTGSFVYELSAAVPAGETILMWKATS